MHAYAQFFISRTHTGKRPYRCPFDGCSKSFVRKTMLTKHMKHDHASNGKRPSVQWRPFIEERRLVQQQQQQLRQQRCTCAECFYGVMHSPLAWQQSAVAGSSPPPAPPSLIVESPSSSSVDDLPPTSPGLLPSPYYPSQPGVVLPSLSSFIGAKEQPESRRDSGISLYSLWSNHQHFPPTFITMHKPWYTKLDLLQHTTYNPCYTPSPYTTQHLLTIQSPIHIHPLLDHLWSYITALAPFSLFLWLIRSKSSNCLRWCLMDHIYLMHKHAWAFFSQYTHMFKSFLLLFLRSSLLIHTPTIPRLSPPLPICPWHPISSYGYYNFHCAHVHNFKMPHTRRNSNKKSSLFVLLFISLPTPCGGKGLMQGTWEEKEFPQVIYMMMYVCARVLDPFLAHGNGLSVVLIHKFGSTCM